MNVSFVVSDGVGEGLDHGHAPFGDIIRDIQDTHEISEGSIACVTLPFTDRLF